VADSNPDLINLYRRLVAEGEDFIRYCRRLFTPAHNNAERYYALRDQFNRLRDGRRRQALFLYLNRHCYNGLCRYNSRGELNMPFGRFKRPYFPDQEMRAFAAAGQRAEFIVAGFRDTMKLARRGDVVYCDPPYVPLSRTAHFTDYHVGGFDWNDQILLAETAQALAGRGVQVVISNHDIAAIRDLYADAGARISHFKVQRNISRDSTNRKPVGELLAVFG
jgi:DNA adenine methylase